MKLSLGHTSRFGLAPHSCKIFQLSLKIKRGDWKYNTNYHEILPKTKSLPASHFIN